MKKMNKILCLMLVGVMVFALCACGDDEKDTESGKESTSVTLVIC